MSAVSHHHHSVSQYLRELADPEDLAFIVSLLLISILIAAAMFAPPSFFVR